MRYGILKHAHGFVITLVLAEVERRIADLSDVTIEEAETILSALEAVANLGPLPPPPGPDPVPLA